MRACYSEAIAISSDERWVNPRSKELACRKWIELSPHTESTIVHKLYEECQEAIELFTERFPEHKIKSKEVFPNKSLRQHSTAPIRFELERLEDECIVPIEQTAQKEGRQIGSLIFDGGLLRKRAGFDGTAVKSLLLRMQENVKANMGVDIEIAAVKPF
jgi:hypothetical protein